jgi:hypothetical protein
VPACSTGALGAITAPVVRLTREIRLIAKQSTD